MRNRLLPIFIAVFVSNAFAAISYGTVKMPTTKAAYFISKDSLVTSASAQPLLGDILSEQGGCTLSCPGTCSYRFTGCNGIYVFQIPLDSVHFSSPIDTLNSALIRRADPGLSISAQSMYGKESNPGISFMIKDCLGNFAIFRVVSVETKPRGQIYPGDCFGYEMFSITANWSYQADGSLIFQPPTSVVDDRPIHSGVLHCSLYQATVSTFNKQRCQLYDILGRPTDLLKTKGISLVIRRNP
jgi:hypothetical protein